VVKRVIVGAHYGLRDWLAQRVTAVVMLAYTLVFLLALGRGPVNFQSWKALFAQEWMRIATFLFVASVLIHAWIGVRNVLMDYFKPVGLRLTFQVLVILALAGYAGWAMQILWRA
jgi:succinate dehydrogenase / fumarate reductase, membrane anchor subunit